MKNDASKTLLDIVAPSGGTTTRFATGKAFLDCLRIVLAKISILDWTSMDKSAHNLVVTDVKQKLPGILRTGCYVPRSIAADSTILAHCKETVMFRDTRTKAVILMKEVCRAYPAFATKWTALIDIVSLDEVSDDAIDFGFDVTALEAGSMEMIQKRRC
ncbi:unnamed protein product [Phytophthora lilii]|uniref:Unnamed protein product n=1 Tax=Phytophthora lilii TaxID=2077276 RepID=A0A9W6TG62_9STRA|nr:unnamed protein product [Phytophthora lilii]